MSIQYDEPGVLYDDPRYTYDGTSLVPVAHRGQSKEKHANLQKHSRPQQLSTGRRPCP